MTRRRTGASLLGILGLILLGQLVTPGPWMYLWPVLPLAGASALLLARTGLPALGWTPLVACVGCVVLFGVAGQPWAWCLVAGLGATGLLGVAERLGGTPAQRAWGYLPVVGLAVLLPLSPAYADLVTAAVRAITAEEARQLAALRQLDFKPDQRVAIEQGAAVWGRLQLMVARNVIPGLLVAWVGLLVHLAERLARHLADLVRRPLPPVPPYVLFRLPDAAAWLLVAGLALVAVRAEPGRVIGLNLSLAAALAYGVQGLAVIKAVLSGLGMAPGMAVVLFIFCSLLLGPVVAPAVAAGVGLLDHWLDFRRLEPRRDESEAEGGEPWK